MAKDIPASVRQRLLKISKSTGQEANLVWTRYAIERLLYRLSISEHANNFTLKGAMLFLAWTGKSHRPTRDLDLLGSGDSSEAHVVSVFQRICGIQCEPDGIAFDSTTIQVAQIREDQEYEGLRVILKARIDSVEITLQIDIGFGDTIFPAAHDLKYPALLEFPATLIRGYPPETVIAEKFQAMVMLGIGNSRMKDFYDIREIARQFTFRGAELAGAIAATFARRRTPVPATPPLALTDAFANDESKLTLWKGFLNRTGLATDVTLPLKTVIAELRDFLLPVLQNGFDKKWKPGGRWL